VLHPAGDRVLLIHHAKLGLWLQPGGHVEPGDETIMGAARREILEETGVADITPVVSGLVDIDIHEFPESGGQPFHRHFDLRFGFVSARESLGASDEVLAARWATAADIHDLALDRSVLRPVGKLLAGG
jgi:8-oxo-dGTP pyrophosphatase MutT (NUDIX family)